MIVCMADPAFGSVFLCTLLDFLLKCLDFCVYSVFHFGLNCIYKLAIFWRRFSFVMSVICFVLLCSVVYPDWVSFWPCLVYCFVYFYCSRFVPLFLGAVGFIFCRRYYPVFFLL